MHHTEISILIPTYNRPGYLIECLESCLIQDLFATQKIEIIITDNSDNDDTANALKPYLEKHTSIRYQKNSTNLGMTGNWNECLTLATGKYIIFLSDDDKLYDAESLSTLYNYLITHPHIGAVSGKKVIIDDHGHLIADMEYIVTQDEVILRPVDFIKANVIGFGGTLYRFYPDIRADHRTGMYADRDYNFAFIHRAPIALISHPVFLNRVHKTNLGKVERGVMETVKWFYFMYKKNNMPRGKMMSILGLRTISLSIRKILAKLNAKKVTKVYTKLLRFALRIKNGA